MRPPHGCQCDDAVRKAGTQRGLYTAMARMIGYNPSIMSVNRITRSSTMPRMYSGGAQADTDPSSRRHLRHRRRQQCTSAVQDAGEHVKASTTLVPNRCTAEITAASSAICCWRGSEMGVDPPGAAAISTAQPRIHTIPTAISAFDSHPAAPASRRAGPSKRAAIGVSVMRGYQQPGARTRQVRRGRRSDQPRD